MGGGEWVKDSQKKESGHRMASFFCASLKPSNHCREQAVGLVKTIIGDEPRGTRLTCSMMDILEAGVMLSL